MSKTTSSPALPCPRQPRDEQGQPYEERYGSKEADGSPVRFRRDVSRHRAVAGSHPLHLSRLFDEYHVDGVYIDQISAMSPKLCFDTTHGHPLGGGHWWVEGYWAMLQSIRDAMPEGAMLTSECNSEPFARWFDGYLTWTQQHDGQVPALWRSMAAPSRCLDVLTVAGKPRAWHCA